MKAIYTITNKQNNNQYVGSTKDYTKRKKRHITDLRNGVHHSQYLQRAFDKHGESSFEFSVYKELSDSCDQFLEEELAIIDLQPSYNVGSVGGGDNLTNNPNREAIIEKIRDSLIEKYANMSKEERSEIYGRLGEANGNWRGGHKHFCDCGNPIQPTAKTCFSCKPISGENNPFFGKSHSEETKQKLSEANKGKLPPNTYKVSAEGTIYSSMSEAARAYSMNVSAMKYRVDSSSDKWKDYYKA